MTRPNLARLCVVFQANPALSRQTFPLYEILAALEPGDDGRGHQDKLQMGYGQLQLQEYGGQRIADTTAAPAAAATEATAVPTPESPARPAPADPNTTPVNSPCVAPAPAAADQAQAEEDQAQAADGAANPRVTAL